VQFLKGGIATRNGAFNALIDRIEEVALRSRDPILLTARPASARRSSRAGSTS
jgi:transcriptional regulatory protein RtcR